MKKFPDYGSLDHQYMPVTNEKLRTSISSNLACNIIANILGFGRIGQK